MENIQIDYSWSFSDKTIKDTGYITHSYYTYPAKFIPQLAQRLIEENSKEGDVIIDPFMGSGTTIVEALVHNRIAIGTDINEIAHLAAKVKTTPLDNWELTEFFYKIENELKRNIIAENISLYVPNNERINFWFLPEQKEKLANILSKIMVVENSSIRDFFLLAFAQILKSSSIWLQKSVKPTRDKNKKLYNPYDLFLQQSRKMIKKHLEFEKTLKAIGNNNINQVVLKCADSRELPCADKVAQLIVTSPPYVTSYEYADLHQLPSLWFGYLENLPEFRKKFIGSSYKERENIDLHSTTAISIVEKLKNKKAKEVENYFMDMYESFVEMKRVLKKGGRACIVIGNTEFKGVKILNAEVFKEQLEYLGFNLHRIIKREIPSKMLPSTRNPQTGQFGKATDENVKLVYPTEYILIMEKL